EVYYEFDLFNEITKLSVTYSGALQRSKWNSKSLEWEALYTHPGVPCDYYGQCGKNAICTLNNAQICTCLAGYKPKSSQAWNMLFWSGGCLREAPLNCTKGEGFMKFKGVKIPDLLQVWMNTSMTLKECEKKCLQNCSCTAYASSNPTGRKTGCLLWYGDLVDIIEYPEYDHLTLYIRATASELDPKKKKRLMVAMITVSVFLILLLAFFVLLKRRLRREGSVKRFRSGPWNGVGFSGIPTIPNLVFNPRAVVTSWEMFYDYGLENDSTTTRSVISYSGEVQRYVWSSSLGWLLIYTLPSDPCDVYGKCGSNGVCTMSNTRICSCLPGYIPKFSQDWEMHVWSGGCIRKHILNCSKGEGFKELEGVKVPDFPNFWISTSVTLNDCEAECLKNCCCTAYANSNVSGRRSGCLLWYGDLVDVRQFARSGNQNLYVRVSASDLGTKNEKQLVVAMVSVSVTVVILFAAFLMIWRRRKQAQGRKSETHAGDEEDLELPIFKRSIIAEATDNFSESNKIGEGGFGPVY
ncbi:hypothetical protein RJ639_042736, partial [Escallonia herrerae]